MKQQCRFAWRKHIPEDMLKAALVYHKLENLRYEYDKHNRQTTIFADEQEWRTTPWGMEFIDELLKQTNLWSSYSTQMTYAKLDIFMDIYKRAKQMSTPYCLDL